ncbi:MAG TPA: DUF192 domain-containing protein [Candidatus Saccharimonadales bacterium]|nr:DUF192 domain-containing protein [Candidatus Saccharimonadales bacterium]
MPSNVKRKTASEPSLRALQRIVAGVAMLLLLIWFVFGMGQRHSAQQRLDFGKHTFWLEVADTPAKQAKGLGDRSGLAANHGMLFVFNDSDVRCFWMKDTAMPLDMIWLSANKEVLYVANNVQPNTYPATFCANNNPAQFVIELAAGQAKKAGLHPGATMRW